MCLKNREGKAMGLPLRNLPINFQIHDLGRTHLVINNTSWIWTSLRKKKKTLQISENNLLERYWDTSLNLSKIWTSKYSGFPHRSKVRPPIIQTSYVGPPNYVCWAIRLYSMLIARVKETQRHVLLCPQLFKSSLKAINSLPAQTPGNWKVHKARA